MDRWTDQQTCLLIEMQFYISVMFLGLPDNIQEEKPSFYGTDYRHCIASTRKTERRTGFYCNSKRTKWAKEPLHPTTCDKEKYVPYWGHIHLNGCIDSWILDSMLMGYEFTCSEILWATPLPPLRKRKALIHMICYIPIITQSIALDVWIMFSFRATCEYVWSIFRLLLFTISMS